MTETIRSLEHQILELKARLSEARKDAPLELVTDYSFESLDGEVSLGALFDGKQDLFVIHNMGKSCNYCSLWADGVNGYLPHLSERASVVLVSPDDPATQGEFARTRGWKFRMVSDASGDFTKAMGMLDSDNDYHPGVSTFHKSQDGKVFRKNNTHFGPGDDFCPVWPLFELLAGGSDGWEPRK